MSEIAFALSYLVIGAFGIIIGLLLGVIFVAGAVRSELDAGHLTREQARGILRRLERRR